MGVVLSLSTFEVTTKKLYQVYAQSPTLHTFIGYPDSMRACLEAFKVAVRVRHLYKRAGSRQLKLSIYQLCTLQCTGLKLRGQPPDQRETSHRCIECTQKDVEAIVNRLALLLRCTELYPANGGHGPRWEECFKARKPNEKGTSLGVVGGELTNRGPLLKGLASSGGVR